MWTVVIVSAFAALFFSGQLQIPQISPELLGLIGISTASAVTAGAVKSSKDIQSVAAQDRSTTLQDVMAKVQVRGLSSRDIDLIRAAAERPVPKVPKQPQPRVSHVLLEEEGEEAGKVVSVTKFQNLLLTLVAGLAVVLMIADQQTLVLMLPAEFLWLLGTSHGAYVGGKLPNKR